MSACTVSGIPQRLLCTNFLRNIEQSITMLKCSNFSNFAKLCSIRHDALKSSSILASFDFMRNVLGVHGDPLCPSWRHSVPPNVCESPSKSTYVSCHCRMTCFKLGVFPTPLIFVKFNDDCAIVVALVPGISINFFAALIWIWDSVPSRSVAVNTPGHLFLRMFWAAERCRYLFNFQATRRSGHPLRILLNCLYVPVCCSLMWLVGARVVTTSV